MRILRRILLTLLAGSLALGALGAGGFLYLTRRPFPHIDGRLRLAGLNAPVSIIRDTFGIPHIYASTTRDLFIAQGYAHAQDRLWQNNSRFILTLGQSGLQYHPHYDDMVDA